MAVSRRRAGMCHRLAGTVKRGLRSIRSVSAGEPRLVPESAAAARMSVADKGRQKSRQQMPSSGATYNSESVRGNSLAGTELAN